MFEQIPDIVLINSFDYLPHGDKLNVERVCHRFNRLMNEVWDKKRTIVFPYDIWQINPKYPLSSYLDDIGPEMGVLIDHCPNLEELRFEDFRRLQIFLQVSCITHFERYRHFNVQKLYIGSKYVTTLDMVQEMGRVFPDIEELTLMHPYPLMHKIRPDTMNVLHLRIPNLEPQLWTLIDDNARVTEDIRLCLDLFTKLKVLTMKDVQFHILVAP